MAAVFVCSIAVGCDKGGEAYCCPHLRLLAMLTVLPQVIPWITENAAGQVKMTMFTMPQPWHPQSVALAEAVLAVETVDQAAYVRVCWS